MYKEIIKMLLNGDASCLTSDVIYNINQIVLNLINKEPLTQYEVEVIGDILHISNIIYNNTDRSILVLEDGVYDLLLVKYKRYNPNFQVGAEPVTFKPTGQIQKNGGAGNMSYNVSPFYHINIPNDMLFRDNLIIDNRDAAIVDMDNGGSTVSKRLRNTSHK